MRKYLLKIVLVTLIYFASAKFGLSLAYSVKQVTLVWPPTGISLALLVIFGFDLWPGIIIGAFVANLTTNETLPIAFWIAIGNTLEALVGAYLLKLFKFERSFEKIKDVVIFVVFAAVISTMVSATIGTASLIFGGIGSWGNYFPVWSNWWAGDLLGDIIVAPAILVWFRSDKFKLNLRYVFEGLVFMAIVVFFSLCLFTGIFP